MIEPKDYWLNLTKRIIDKAQHFVKVVEERGLTVIYTDDVRCKRIKMKYYIKLYEPKDFIGCTDEEIKKLEDEFHIKLPKTYKEFLRVFGKTSKLFSDLTYNYDFIQKFNRSEFKFCFPPLHGDEEYNYDDFFIIGTIQPAFICIDVNDNYVCKTTKVMDNPVYLCSFDWDFEDSTFHNGGCFTVFMKDFMEYGFGGYSWVLR